LLKNFNNGECSARIGWWLVVIQFTFEHTSTACRVYDADFGVFWRKNGWHEFPWHGDRWAKSARTPLRLWWKRWREISVVKWTHHEYVLKCADKEQIGVLYLEKYDGAGQELVTGFMTMLVSACPIVAS